MMQPYDRAMAAVKVAQRPGDYAVVLEHRLAKVEIWATPDQVEASKVAAAVTIVLARIIADAMADEASTIAAQLNSHTLDGWGITATEFLTWCRERAEMHTGKAPAPASTKASPG